MYMYPCFPSLPPFSPSLPSQDINNNEELLGWDTTPYPLIHTLLTMKEPFDRLWNTTLDFHVKHDKWMNGR